MQNCEARRAETIGRHRDRAARERHEQLVEYERALAAHRQPRGAVVERAQHDQKLVDRIQLRPQPERRRRAAEEDR